MRKQLTPQIEEALTYARNVLLETVSVSKKGIKDPLTFSQHTAIATLNKALAMPYEARVRQLESEGLTRSDAQAVADTEFR